MSSPSMEPTGPRITQHHPVRSFSPYPSITLSPASRPLPRKPLPPLGPAPQAQLQSPHPWNLPRGKIMAESGENSCPGGRQAAAGEGCAACFQDWSGEQAGHCRGTRRLLGLKPGMTAGLVRLKRTLRPGGGAALCLMPTWVLLCPPGSPTGVQGLSHPPQSPQESEPIKKIHFTVDFGVCRGSAAGARGTEQAECQPGARDMVKRPLCWAPSPWSPPTAPGSPRTLRALLGPRQSQKTLVE